MTLASDIMFVNGNSFIITSSRKLRFVTVKHIPSHTEGDLSKSLNGVMKFYGRVVLVICVILMGVEFNKFMYLLAQVEVNIAAT